MKNIIPNGCKSKANEAMSPKICETPIMINSNAYIYKLKMNDFNYLMISINF